MLKVKRNVLSVALASAMFANAGLAGAQEAAPAPTPQQQAEADAKAKAEAEAKAAADAQTLDAIEVTGIRAAIEASIDTKRENTSIVEAISSEDIGKLPDTSIADSLARLPGLTAQRFGNRPQEINIRGFAGDFSTGLLNGREQASPSNTRSVEFDQYPSELINKVIVYKTPDASLVGQGLSGTIDMHTVSPLDYGEQIFTANYRYDVNELDDEKANGSRVSFSYIDQFNDNTVGLALGYAVLNSPTQANQFGSWGYDHSDVTPDSGAISGADLWDVEGEVERAGLMGVFEYKPNEDFHSRVDFFHSEFDREENKSGFQFSTQTWTGAALNGRTDDSDGTAIDVTYDDVGFAVTRGDFNASYDDMISVGWNTEWRFADKWTATADVSYSDVHREERILETYARLAPGLLLDGVTATHNGDYYDFSFPIDLTDPNNFRMMDPGGWGGAVPQAGYLKDFIVEDELLALRLDLERTFDDSMFSSVSFGGNVTDREKSRASSEATLCTTPTCTGNPEVAVPTEYLNGTFSFAGLEFMGLDAIGLLNNFYYQQRKDHADIYNKNWDIEETVSTIYGQLNIDTDWGDVPVRGNIGLQAVHADQSSTGVAIFNGIALGEPATYGKTNTDWLPSLNLSFQFVHDQFLRVAAARQMARPRMDEMRANANYSYNNQQQEFTGSGGNPLLDPWIANAFDLSYEKYFAGNRGYVSLAYFYKDLRTYIYPDTDFDFDFSALPIPPEALPPGVTDFSGTYSSPMNGEGGRVSGWETAVSLPLDLLWEPLEGFGIQANYSDTSSSIQAFGPPPAPPGPIAGLSEEVWNASVFYERYGFAARVSQRHRSEFFGEVQGFGGDRVRQNFGGETVTDVSVGYAFQEGPLQDLSILLQVNNLENEPFTSQQDGYSARPTNYQEFGRTTLLGISYKW
jgi:iron complex outermembrane recepter protein